MTAVLLFAMAGNTLVTLDLVFVDSSCWLLVVNGGVNCVLLQSECNKGKATYGIQYYEP
jgi:hypothetical protein